MKIELPDGYAVIADKMRHQTSKLVRQEMRKYMKPHSKAMLLSDMEKGDPITLGDFEVDLGAIPQDDINDIIILHQVTEWSYGTVDEKALSDLASDTYNVLVKEMDRVYGSPLADAGNSPKPLS